MYHMHAHSAVGSVEMSGTETSRTELQRGGSFRDGVVGRRGPLIEEEETELNSRPKCRCCGSVRWMTRWIGLTSSFRGFRETCI